MVENLTVELLWNPLIEAAVAGLHVENRDFPAFGRNYRQAGIGVAIKQECIGLFQLKYIIRLGNHLGNGLRRGVTCCPEKMIGFTNFQIIEKHLIQFEIVVLT